MAEQRTYSSGRVGLELDGVFVGPLIEVEGGEVFGLVAVEAGGQGQRRGKHIANIDYAPIMMRFGSGMGEALYAWIGDTLGGKPSERSGAVVMADFDGRSQSRLEFSHAMIAEVAFDHLNGDSRGPWQITLTVQPQSTRRTVASASIPNLRGKVKSAQMGNFRVSIPGLPTNRISRVELPTATVELSQAIGDLHRPDPSTTLTFTNLVVTTNAIDGTAFLDAADKFLVQGQSAQTDELNGKVELLGPNMVDVLFTITLSQLGFVRVAPERMGSGTGADVLRRVRAELYCESMGFATTHGAQDQPSSGTAGGTTSATTDTVLSTAMLGLLGSGRADPANLQVATELLANGHLLRPDPSLVALRLQGTPTASAAGVGAGALQRDDGVAIGRAWAQQQASLDELTTIGALESADWDAVALPAGHSLLARLVDNGIVAGDAEHPADLDRSAFVEGLVSGAVEALREVTPHLRPLPSLTKEIP